jgi:hypothetical protein
MAKNDDKKPQQNDKKPESTEQTKVDAKPPEPPLEEPKVEIPADAQIQLAETQKLLRGAEEENTLLREKLNQQADEITTLRSNLAAAEKHIATLDDQINRVVDDNGYGELSKLPMLFERFLHKDADPIKPDEDHGLLSTFMDLLARAKGRLEVLLHEANKEKHGERPPIKMKMDYAVSVPGGGMTTASAGQIYRVEHLGEQGYDRMRKQLPPDVYELYYGPTR